MRVASFDGGIAPAEGEDRSITCLECMVMGKLANGTVAVAVVVVAAVVDESMGSGSTVVGDGTQSSTHCPYRS